MSENIIYEQPLHERVRTFLRLEFLFMQAANHVKKDSAWDSRAALEAIIEILNIFSRADLRKDVLKEMDRNAAGLAKLAENPHVDQTRLREVLAELEGLNERLHGNDAQIGQVLRDNEFINGIKQRSSIAGGSCDFDLPAYHRWLQQAPETRRRDMQRWLSEFNSIYFAIRLVLRLIRESAPPIPCVAEAGFYQQSLDANQPFQMVRVSVPVELPYFAEISAGKHRFTVRFMETPELEKRPIQTADDVEFLLTCCAI